MEMQRVYVRFKGRVLGPFALSKAIEMAKRGQITRQHELSPDGQSWRPGVEFPELFGKPQSVEMAVQAQPAMATAPQQQPAPVQPTEWFAHFDGQNQGPVDENTLRQWIQMGKIDGSTPIWKEGMDAWLAAELLRPGWFGNKPHDASQKQSTVSNSVMAESLAKELLKQRGWTTFLGILAITFGILNLIADFAWFLFAISRASDERDVVIPLLFSLTALALSAAMTVSGFLLLKYATSLSSLEFQPTLERILIATNRLTKFWVFTGITVLVWLLIICFLVFLVYVAGLKMSQMVY